MQEIFVQQWYEHEYEPGWGATDRSGGYSFHLTEKSAKEYIEETLKRNENQSGGYYFGFHTDGKLLKMSVDNDMYDKIKNHKGVFRSDSIKTETTTKLKGVKGVE